MQTKYSNVCIRFTTSKLAAVCVVLIVSGCATDPVADLCKLDSAYSDKVIATSNINNSIVDGPVNTIAIQSGIHMLPSAVATTTNPYIAIPTPCMTSYGPRYCPVYVNLQGVYGIGRGDTIHVAESLALENCESAVETFTNNTHIFALDDSLQCVIKRRDNCAVR